MAGGAVSAMNAEIDALLTASGWAVAHQAHRTPATTLSPVALPEPDAAAYLLCARQRVQGVVEVRVGPPSGDPDHGAAFRYATDGAQIWFHDVRRPENEPRLVAGIHTVTALAELLENDAARAVESLKQLDHRPHLRPYQVEASNAIERALVAGERRVLVEMAAGTGKTHVGAEEIHRLLRAGLARRALYLVDREILLAQAATAFAPAAFDVPVVVGELPEALVSGARPHDSVVCVCVAADIAARSPALPIHTFDLIVVDDCRARDVLEHFDALAIGLTATDSGETADGFPAPIHRYDRDRAIAEGCVVAYDVVRLQSEARITPGPPPEVVGDITARDPNRRILALLRQHAEEHRAAHGLYPKTLIFAADNEHADDLVLEARGIFMRGDEFVTKITDDVEDPLTRIHEFRVNPEPCIAVTLDLLAAGFDLPDVEFVVLLRPVTSRTAFERMVGRGTRLGDKVVDKTRFVVFDCFDGTLVDAFGGAPVLDIPAQDRREAIEYLKAFSRWIRDEAEEIPALSVLLDRPEEWRPEAMIALRDTIRTTAHFTEDGLAHAHALLHDTPPPDLISMVKHAARDSASLLTAEERAAAAVDAAVDGQVLNTEQALWIARIRYHLAEHLAIDREDFMLDRALVYHGGWHTADATFDGRLGPLLTQLNRRIAAA